MILGIIFLSVIFVVSVLDLSLSGEDKGTLSFVVVAVLGAIWLTGLTTSGEKIGKVEKTLYSQAWLYSK